MPLPQPNRSHDDALHDLDEVTNTTPHIPTELVEIVAEGFQLIHEALVQIVDYLDRRQYSEDVVYLTAVEDRMAKLKDFVEN